MPPLMTRPRPYPLIAAAVAFGCILLGAARYPGGYDWLNQSVSSLFQPTTAVGEANAGRWPASIGVVLFCASMAFVFVRVARLMPTRAHFKMVQIGGIGSMVYAALVTTPMHDALISFALVFFVVAMLAILHGLFVQGRLGMLSIGALALSLIGLNALIHYGNLLGGFLPVVQKLSLCIWIPWLFVLAYGKVGRSDSGAP